MRVGSGDLTLLQNTISNIWKVLYQIYMESVISNVDRVFIQLSCRILYTTYVYVHLSSCIKLASMCALIKCIIY